MAGVKGRSGRKTFLKEKTTEEIVNLSADIIKTWLENPEVDEAKKISVAKDIFLKRLPTDVNQNITGNLDLKSLLGDEFK